MIEESLSDNRLIKIPGDAEKSLAFAVDDWIESAVTAIEKKGSFFVALSGGSTPKKIFQALEEKAKNRIDFSKVFLFWSDERAVDPTDQESNYHMAMVEGNLQSIGLKPENIFRMQAENTIQEHALLYEQQIKKLIPDLSFDLIMLGMGTDGHTASLFPHTKALQEQDRLVVENEVPQKKCYRMTFTYPLINKAKKIVMYVFGKGKEDILEKVLYGPYLPFEHPSQNIGTQSHPLTIIADQEAAARVLAHI